MQSPKLKFSSSAVIDSLTSADDLVKVLLKNRGLSSKDVNNFLNPPKPSALSFSAFSLSAVQIKKAISRINKAIKNKENILIYGDYDADGITSTAILWQALFSLKAKVFPFIPHRQTDGYGLKASSVTRLSKQKKQNFDLIITLDNGISAQKEIKKLPSNTDLIIVDHHIPPKKLPPAHAIVHSTITSTSVLSWLLSSKLVSRPDLGLAAIGLVADCQPLIGPNRSVVFHGLKSLNSQPSFAISALNPPSLGKNLSATDLAFSLAPQLNAVGRLADPTDALRLLCAQNARQANLYAKKLFSYNQDRQSLQKKAISKADRLTLSPSQKIIVTTSPGYHPGIIGLVASHLTQKYNLPSIAISLKDKTEAKGSCRSVPGFNIIKALRLYSSLFIDLGGHAAAAGFTILPKNIPILEKKINLLAQKKLAKIDSTPTFTVDASARLSALKTSLIKAIAKLQPCGIGNPTPLFYLPGLKVLSKRLLGSDLSHLRLILDDPNTARIENSPATAIAFKKGHLGATLPPGQLVDIIASFELNTWNGRTTPQLVVREIFLHS